MNDEVKADADEDGKRIMNAEGGEVIRINRPTTIYGRLIVWVDTDEELEDKP